MEFKIAKNEDAKNVYELVQETIKLVYPKYYLKEIVEMFCEHHSLENILKDIADNNTYVLIDNNKIIGTGTKKENHITRVYVLPNYQKKGHGTFIMNNLEEIIKGKYESAYIDASLPACRLYAHLGYKTVDHGIWECKNDVIQVYEIMKKQLLKLDEKLILRPYKPKDAKAIVTWIKDEKELRKWSFDRYGAYPITSEDINHKYLDCNGDCEEDDNFYPMTLTDENGPIGHLILRYTDEDKMIIRLGFIIIDDKKRGMGYGKRMIQMAIKYVFDMLKAKKLILGVFDNNTSAYNCYKAVGFKEIPMEQDSVYEIYGEKTRLIWMSMEPES